jgi:hypothetical protein
MIFSWIEREFSEGELWSLSPTHRVDPEHDISDAWDVTSHNDHHLLPVPMHSQPYLRPKALPQLDGTVDSTVDMSL